MADKKVDQFLDSPVNHDKENINANILTAMGVKDIDFDFEFIRSKSEAAEGLCSRAIIMCKLSCAGSTRSTAQEIYYCEVEPKH